MALCFFPSFPAMKKLPGNISTKKVWTVSFPAHSPASTKPGCSRNLTLHCQSTRIGSSPGRPSRSTLLSTGLLAAKKSPTLKIEIINTGAELMLGRVLNTHQQWLCRQLTDHGYLVSRQVAVDDSPESIRDAIAQALGSADLIITTGGLGTTSDDRTRDVIAQF